jgi:hypothetical protein
VQASENMNCDRQAFVVVRHHSQHFAWRGMPRSARFHGHTISDSTAELPLDRGAASVTSGRGIRARVVVSVVLPLARAREAFEQALGGHRRGKIVLQVAAAEPAKA